MKHFRVGLMGAVCCASAGACLLLWPVAAASADGSGSDTAFNNMVSELAGRDTGSMWFDYYVERLNQDIAIKTELEPYGLAGPNGPMSGFDGYVANFVQMDTGSVWFNNYVDQLNRHLREKEQAIHF